MFELNELVERTEIFIGKHAELTVTQIVAPDYLAENTVQVAILLDTSNSMDLIDQTKSRLWNSEYFDDFEIRRGNSEN